jgi:hypothetical protein
MKKNEQKKITAKWFIKTKTGGKSQETIYNLTKNNVCRKRL